VVSDKCLNPHIHENFQANLIYRIRYRDYMPDGFNQSKMTKHRIVITQHNNKITSVLASGETEVYLVQQGQGIDLVSKLDPDEFEIGKAHEAFMGNAKQFLKEKKV